MYYNENTTIFLDGNWMKASEASTDLYAQTMHYGSGVFEGIRSYATEEGARVFKAHEHYERLFYSAEKMHIKLDYTVDQLVELTYQLLDRNGLHNAYIRPLVYLGANMTLQPTDEVHVMLCAWSWDRYLGDQLLSVMTSSYQRPNPKSCHVEAKVTGHYTNSILATTEAKQKGFDEALLLDMNGYVAEGPGANFFFEKDEKLFTAPLGNILAGITRQTVFELADELGIEVVEKHFTPEDVYDADGAFFTGTAAEVAGIESLDGNTFGLQWEETLGAVLSTAYLNRVQKLEYKNFELV
ncbi:branched-chain amino acid transaminase [Aureitalea sp. L0-47]|uniref:branched-chain amino acid transaminase n=1 Tax=Aureitalea sp. L0-47 TaxID=2816962 RepID=UPI00223744F7|nr:branched-chain amino acid transaminase [Aureitalea sp. L0-47]MCW5518810.1 branched-chain amino acid transaminase [Aureitalea sp. L0-47]